MPRIWLAAMAAALLVLTACVPATSPPPPPAEARPLTGSGAHEQRMDGVIEELRDALEGRHGRLEIQAYRLPAGAAWPAVVAHYRSALAGWDNEPALPEKIRAAHGRAWTRGGALVAIALVDTPVPGEAPEYAMLLVATRP